MKTSFLYSMSHFWRSSLNSVSIYKIIVGFTIVFLFLFNTIGLKAQDNVTKLPVSLSIPAKANISLAGSDLKLSLVSKDNEQKQVITPNSSASIWINYSSVVENNSSNAIFVSIFSNSLPAEISIKLTIGEDEGGGTGEVGKPTEPITITSFPQSIITNIGSCYTGKGVGKGHKLTYSWELAPNYDPDLLKLEDLQVEADVIYTISNN
jgi:hypothetical protein